MRNRSVFQIGCLTLGLLALPYQLPAAGGDGPKTNPQVGPAAASRQETIRSVTRSVMSNPAAVSLASNGQVASVKLTAPVSNAAAIRIVVPPTLTKQQQPAAASNAASPVNHLDRAALDARVAPAGATTSRVRLTPPDNKASERLAPASVPSQKEKLSTPLAVGRVQTIPPDVKSN